MMHLYGSKLCRPPQLLVQTSHTEFESEPLNIFGHATCRQMHGLTQKADNALGLYSESAWFESRQDTPAILTGYFRAYLLSLESGIGPRLGYHHFLPNPFQFVIRQSSHHLTLRKVNHKRGT
jgi:hypothetical protein